MTTLAITRRPIAFSVGASASMLTDILARIASIRGRASEWGVTDDATMAEYLAGQSVEADFTQAYYRNGFVEGGAPEIIPGWAFSRASAGTAIDAAGAVQTFASGEPRINDRGLVTERAATNLLLHSAAFDEAAWTRVSSGNGFNPSITQNGAVAPDRTMTAEVIVFDRGASDVSGDLSFLTQSSIPTSTAAAYSGSIWLRSDTPCTLLIRHVGAGSYTLVSVTDTWTRFSVSESAAGTSSDFEIGLRGGFGASQTATVEAWGAQLEAGNLTSYIATGGSTATRAADIVTGPAVESSGTILMEFEAPLHDGVQRRLATFPEHLPLYVTDGVVGTSAPAGVLAAPGAALTPGTIARAAVTWTAGRRAIVRNGGTVGTDANPLPSNELVYIGGDANQFRYPIRRFIRFNVAVSDALLQAMTA